jgi:anti-sigma factor RsiW
MNEDPLSSLRDLLLRRDLGPEEERRVSEWLQRHPEAAAAWQTDLVLARRLRRLPPAPVPSNFTSRVLAEVRRESSPTAARPAANSWFAWLRSRPLAATTAALVVLGTAWTAQQVQRQRAHRQAAYTRQVSALRALVDLSPTVLEDFDAIQRFDPGSPAVDFELLAALQ